ncbi:putative leucine-rich repeat receptor-like protein kinase [Platanthera guangdongensis]|uniref:Leucine-rich repeat receptor-like protein kinase n=1 Tax=Platanthera guangdongensis TaxID=2320717 RepID=A0ABR2LC65_9ASPA
MDKTFKIWKLDRVLSSHAFKFVVLLAFLLLNACRGVNMEGKYLLDIKSLLKDDWGRLDSWRDGEVTPCCWTGMNCSSDYDPVVARAFAPGSGQEVLGSALAEGGPRALGRMS